MPFYLLLGLLAGLAAASQSPINARLAQTLGGLPLLAALLSFAIGTLALLALAGWRGQLGALAGLGSAPLWQLSGGLLGAVFVFITVSLVPKLGVATLFFLIVLGQIGGALLIDRLGLFGLPVRALSGPKLAGLALLLLGLLLFCFGEGWWALLTRKN